MALSPSLMKMVAGAANKYKSSGGKSVKPKEGRNIYRLLVPTEEQFWADLGVHWIKADENGKPLAVVGDCDVVFQRPSVINVAIEMAINSAMDEDSKKLFESWKSRKSVLLNVIERPSTDEVVVLELTPTTFGKVMDLVQLYLDAGQDITDPATGVDIIITRTGKGLNTNYDVAVAPGVSKPVAKETLGKCEDLMKFIESNFFRGEEQKALNAIQQIAGVAVPRLGGAATSAGATTPTAALSSPAAAVADAPAETKPAETKAEEPAGPTPEEKALAEKRAAIAKRQAEAAAAAAAELAELEEMEAATTAASVSSLPTSEQDAILAELDGLK